MIDITECPLTGYPVRNIDLKHDRLEYSILIDTKLYSISLCSKCFKKKKSLLDGKTHIIRSLYLNGKLPELEDKIIHLDGGDVNKPEDFDIIQHLEQATYPRTPKEKFDYLFNELYKMQNYEGEAIDIDTRINWSSLWERWFFRNRQEYELYFYSIVDEGLVVKNLSINKGALDTFNITYKGLNYYIQTFEEGFNSKFCFIAMAFNEDMGPVREAIKKAITDTGFNPLIVDENNVDSDRTINDEIFAGVKKSKFCIADFSHHRNGVYFESGFALGLGKPVIYCCGAEHFKQAHFDIRPLQHIIYQSPEELHNSLVHKIEVWIK